MEYWLYLTTVAILSVGVVIAASREHIASHIFSMLAIVFVRAVPNLPPTMHWRWDSYYYFTLTQGVLRTGHLALPPGFPGETHPDRLAHGAYNVLSAEVGLIVDLTGAPLRLYFPITLGILGYLAGVILFRKVINNRFALMGAYLFAMLPSTVVFTHQYHQYGFATMIGLFAIACMFGLEIDSSRKVLLSLPLLIATALSHIFFPSMFVGLLLTGWFSHQVFKKVWAPAQWKDIDVYGRPTIIVLFCLPIFLGVIYTQQNLLILGSRSILGIQADERTIKTATSVAKSGVSIIDSVPLATKIVLTVLSIPTIIGVVRRQATVLETLLVEFLGILFILLLAIILVPEGANGRILIFAYFFLVVVALSSIRHHIPRGSLPAGRTVIAAVLVVSVVVAGTPTRPAPSLVDPNIDISADGFHNVEPIGRVGPTTGEWIQSYYPSNRMLYVSELTSAIAMYYGRLPTYRRWDKWPAPARGGILVDVDRYGNYTVGHRVYDSGRLVIHQDNRLPYPTS